MRRGGRRPLSAAELAGRHVLVRTYIERLADAGLPWPGYRHVVDDLGLPATTRSGRAGIAGGVLEIIRELISEGWMRYRRRGGRTAVELADGRVLPPDDDPARTVRARRAIADLLLEDMRMAIPDRDVPGGERRRSQEGVERPCIRCGRTMRSSGPHHRMCDRCRSEAETWLVGAGLVR